MQGCVNLKNTVVLFFILYYVLTVLCLQVYYGLDLDEGEGDTAKSLFNSIRSSLEVFSLYSQWGYFADPHKTEYYFVIRGYSEGFSAYYYPEFQRTVFKVNYEKKKMYLTRIGRSYSDIRTAYLKSFCGKFKKEHGKTFNKVIFYKHKKQIPELNSSALREMEYVKKWTVEC